MSDRVKQCSVEGCPFIALHRDKKLCEWHEREFAPWHDDIFHSLGEGYLSVYPDLSEIVVENWVRGVRNGWWMRKQLVSIVKGESGA